PPELRGPATTIMRIAGGLSRAGVYKVETAGGVYVLQIARATDPLEAWRRRTDVQQRAATAGVAPRVVHVDPERRAIVSAFVADRGFIPRVIDPRTRADAIADLGRTLRRVHDLPVPDGAAP